MLTLVCSTAMPSSHLKQLPGTSKYGEACGSHPFLTPWVSSDWSGVKLTQGFFFLLVVTQGSKLKAYKKKNLLLCLMGKAQAQFEHDLLMNIKMM